MFQTLPLESVTINHDTKRIPVKEAERKSGPYPYYGASGIVDYVDGYLFDGEYLLVAEDGENLRTRNTPIAFRATGKFWVNNHAHIIQGNDKALTRYLEYAVNLADIASYLTGSTMPKLTQGNLNRLPIVVPPIDVQKKIVKIIGDIDDKIELNNQINKTLESMAKAIFKEWFIDFGPVKAKSEGKKPFGMDDETAALFPDSFEDSELGMIPKGWEVKTLGETCDLLMGQSPPGDTYNENGNGMVFYQGRAEFGSRYPSPRLFCSEPSRIVNAGTVLLSVRAPVGDLNISTEEQTCIGRGLAGILHKTGGTTFTYYLLQSLKDKFDMYNGEGTVFGSINKDTLFGLKIISPPELVLRKFLELVRPLDNLYFSNFIESRSLTQTRDLLLPKLISGELQLNEVTSD